MLPAASTNDADPSPRSAATFLVRGIFVLGTRPLFIVRGIVVSGALRAKQRVTGLPGMDAQVQSVEANLLDINGGEAQSALTFHYAKQAELNRGPQLLAAADVPSLADPLCGPW